MPSVYNALIRTHHITSRKKVAALKAAAKKFKCYAILRSGGSPGAMYVEGDRSDNVKQWIDTVHDLRYKDYQLVVPVSDAPPGSILEMPKLGMLEEVATVKEMGEIMQAKGLYAWWRAGMGFAPS